MPPTDRSNQPGSPDVLHNADPDNKTIIRIVYYRPEPTRTSPTMPSDASRRPTDRARVRGGSDLPHIVGAARAETGKIGIPRVGPSRPDPSPIDNLMKPEMNRYPIADCDGIQWSPISRGSGRSEMAEISQITALFVR